MPAKKTPEDRTKTDRLILAYKKVFGTDGHRTKEQEIVLKDLRERWKVEKPVFLPNWKTGSTPDGLINEVTYDPIKAAITDGARLPVLQIIEFLAQPATEAPKPTVKK